MSKQSAPPDPQVQQALADYLERIDRGEAVDVEAYLKERPIIAPELRSLLAASEMLAGMAGTSASDTAPKDASPTIAPTSVAASALSGPTGTIKFPVMMGRYRLERELGRGAMGNVYLAHDTDLDRPVALKIPKFTAADNQELIARFLREARAAAVLAHPNICRVYDVNEHQGVRYIAMEYIEGKPLSAFIAGGNVQAKQAAAVIRKLALGLAEAHQRNILHRDLKPDNILVNKQGEPVLTDFGLARETTAGKASATQDGVILGSPAYMPPEQAAGNLSEMGPPSDIYSLGVVLYELLTGDVPFRGSVVEVLASVLMKTPKTVREQKPDVDPGIAAICDKMMAKKAADRYPTMMVVAQALGDWLRTGGQQPAAGTSKLPESPSPSGEFKLADPKSKLAAGPHVVEPKKIPGVSDKPKQSIAPGTTKQTIQPTVAKVPERTEKQINDLADLGDQLLARNDYLEAIRLAEEIPDYQRTSALRRMLGEAYELKGKVEKLERNLEKYLNLLDLPELKKTVTALLKIHPGHPRGKEIKKALNTSGKQGVIQILKDEGNYDAVGNVWEPKVLAGGIAAIVAMAVIAYFAVTIYIKGQMQTVVITLDDPTADVKVDNQTVIIKGQQTGEIKLTLGKHEYTVEKDSVAVKNPQSFIVTKDGENKIVITLKEQPIKPGDGVAGTTATTTSPDTGDFSAVLGKHDDEVIGICISPDSKLVYTASNDKTARAWDFAARKEKFRVTSNSGVFAVACSPNGKFLAVTNVDGTITLHDAVSGDLVKTLTGHSTVVQGAAFSRDSSKLASAGGDTTFRVWDVASGQSLKEFKTGTEAGSVAVQFTHDGTEILGAGGDGTIRVFNVETGEKRASWPVHSGATIYSLAISPDGLYVASASADKTVKIHQISNGAETHNLQGHTEINVCADYLSSGRELVSAGQDKKLIVWNLDTKQKTREWRAHEADNLYGPRTVTAAPNGRFLASGGYDRYVRLWSATGNNLSKPSPPPASGNAPPAAVAPFNAAQAKAHQEAWAKYLGVPVEYTNSVGMKFRLIPPGEFLMGSPDSDPDGDTAEKPQHKVRITKPYYLGATEVTQAVWSDLMGTTPWKGQAGEPKEKDAPASAITYDEAIDFCAKLAAQETGQPKYRMPTEAEWEFAHRAGTTTRFATGDDTSVLHDFGWIRYAVEQAGPRTPRPVGTKPPNPFGMYDMTGNVWEWTSDWFEQNYYASSPVENPAGPASGNEKSLRGGAYDDVKEESYRCARRDHAATSHRSAAMGFRVILPVETVQAALKPTGPPFAVAPFDAAQAKAHQEAWAKHLGVPVEYTNSIGMKFRLIPPGEYTMGSTPEQIKEWTDTYPGNEAQAIQARGEGPQHKVILTQPFYLGEHEVTQQQFERIMGVNPSQYHPKSSTEVTRAKVAGKDTSNFPVESVSWPDATQFCAKLSKLPNQTGSYRLPTESEWEFASRAGTTTRYWWGDDSQKVVENENFGNATRPVGSMQPNPFDLYDMNGNVSEWANDWWSVDEFQKFAGQAATDPQGAQDGSARVLRGGSWGVNPVLLGQASLRYSERPGAQGAGYGFRVVLAVDGVPKAAGQDSVFLNSLQETSVEFWEYKPNWGFNKHGMIGLKDETDPSTKIVLGGKPSPHGIFAHPKPDGISSLKYDIGQLSYESFSTTAGIADIKQAGPATAHTFEVYGDGKLLWKSESVPKWGVPQECSGLNIKGVKELELRVVCPGDATWGYAVWCEPRVFNGSDGAKVSGSFPPAAVAPFDATQARAHQETWAKHLGVPVEYTNSIGMKFLLIPPGEFLMGSADSDPDAKANEQPQHQVRLTEPYYLCLTEVSQGQFKTLMGKSPWKGKKHANDEESESASYIHWNDATAFCKKLSAKEGGEYFLPTEAQWEFAARAGSQFRFGAGNTLDDILPFAWTPRENKYSPYAGGLKRPNPFGLMDMQGNCWEWCADPYEDDYYAKSPGEDPRGAAASKRRSMRGGGIASAEEAYRLARREPTTPTDAADAGGFRVALRVSRP